MKQFLIILIMASSFMSAVRAETTYLTAGAMFDPISGRVIENPAVVIEDDVVAAVGDQAGLPAPENAVLIDLGDKTILPGLIDMHVHLIGDDSIRGYKGLSVSTPLAAIHGVAHARDTLMAGFTTVRNVGAGAYADVALRDAINDGVVPGPRLFVSGPPIGIIGGHCSDNNLLPAEYEDYGENVATGPWEMRAQVRKNIKYGVDLIKTCSTGGVFSKGTALGAAQGTVEELTAIVDEAHMRGLKVASHAHGTVGIKNAIRAGVDTIEHASYLDDEAIRMAKRNGVYLSMDIYNTEYTLAQGTANGVLQESLDKERAVGGIQRESFTKAVKAGAKVVLGTDAGVYPHGDNAKQLSRMVQFGMTPLQTLRSATSLAAEALGQGNKLGRIQPGYAADIIAVTGHPLDDVTILEKVEFVMKDGVIYKTP